MNAIVLPSRSVLAAVILTTLVAAGACGPGNGEKDTNNVQPPPTNDGSSDTMPDIDTSMPADATDTGLDTADTGVSDGGDTNTTSDGGDTDGGDAGQCSPSCEINETCVQGQCLKNAKIQCDSAVDKGMLAPGGNLSISGTFDESDIDGLEASCAGRAQRPEKVYKFQVSEDSLITPKANWTGNFVGVLEFRRDACQEAAEEKTSCIQNEKDVWVGGGETVYLVVEADSGEPGAFTVDISSRSAACMPQTYSCDSSQDLQYCQVKDGNPNPISFACPDTCQNAECTGTTCSNAIKVNGSKTYTGDLNAFQAQMNFGENTKCRVGENDDVKANSGGAEVVFEVPLKQGESLDIDTSVDGQDNLIFVGKSCASKVADIECLAATDDEKITGWTAPSDGTYYVIIDKWSIGPGTFNYDFTIK